jgi:hypothetical protein
MTSPGTDRVFNGSIPTLYEAYLVPLIFEPYAADLASRVAARSPRRVLEIAAGTGVVTRRGAREERREHRFVEFHRKDLGAEAQRESVARSSIASGARYYGRPRIRRALPSTCSAAASLSTLSSIRTSGYNLHICSISPRTSASGASSSSVRRCAVRRGGASPVSGAPTSSSLLRHSR